jgi:hypothetical protein
MAQNIDDLIAKLNHFRTDLNSNLEAIVTEMANNAKALAQRNIIDKGLTGREYSRAGVPAYWLLPKALNQAGVKFVKSKIKSKEPIAWRDLRDAQGMQTAHIDLYYSGEMFQMMGVVETRIEGDKVTAVIGGLNQSAQDKMDWNHYHFGDFIEDHIDASDYDFILQLMDDRINTLLKTINL